VGSGRKGTIHGGEPTRCSASPMSQRKKRKANIRRWESLTYLAMAASSFGDAGSIVTGTGTRVARRYVGHRAFGSSVAVPRGAPMSRPRRSCCCRGREVQCGGEGRRRGV
jgi:hypothetical protein